MKSFWARHHPWIIVGCAVLLVFSIRVRLRDMPLERDEGEYAYAGQLILQGVPPYKEAYNMKLPGTYAAYAVIMALLGQTPSGIHVGVALVNAGTVILIFLIGRKLLDDITGIVAAVAYALMSASPSVLGLAGHATHFVTFFAMAGTYLLLSLSSSSSKNQPRTNANKRESSGKRLLQEATEETEVSGPQRSTLNPQPSSGLRSLRYLCWLLLNPHSGFSYCFCGMLFGLAFLMKQHGVFFGIFGGLVLVWRWLSGRNTPKKRKQRMKHGASAIPEPPSCELRHIAVYGLGFLVPYALTCLVLWLCGVFPQFWFWTTSYAAKYATMASSQDASRILHVTADAALSSNLLLLILGCAGAVVQWWDEKVENFRRWFLVLFFLSSLASVSPGFYFRQHYFITLLPIISVLGGIAVSRSLRLLRQDKTIELFAAIPLIALCGIGIIVEIAGNGPTWFALSPADAVHEIYHTTVFAEARAAGQFFRKNVSAGDRIAVLGSEPEIYFYARHRAATAYMYTYPLVEVQSYARGMQDTMIQQVEKANPVFYAYIGDVSSWLDRPGSDRHIFDWWKTFSNDHLELQKILEVKSDPQASLELGGLEVFNPAPITGEFAAEKKQILIYKRRELNHKGR